PRDGDAAGPTAPVVLALLAEWRRFLEELAALFAALVHAAPTHPRGAHLEYAAARLVPLIIERTGGEDAWYGTLATTLRWYAEAAGCSDDHVEATTDQVIRGHFSSWVVPDEAVAQRAFGVLARQIEAGPSPVPVPRDALAAWRALRSAAFQFVPVGRYAPVPGDGHATYIDEVDRVRDPERAERLHAALLLVRDSAARGIPLTVDQLAEWQAVVLGAAAPVPLRTTDAYAKGGRERYAVSFHLRDELARVLDEASDAAVPFAVRAARVYLDVCFYHPFVDGNARAARLALDHVLSSQGFAIHDARPLFQLARAADDHAGTWAFAAALDLLIGPPAAAP
nr:Fic family protein [Myxococcota bacterium]